MIFHRLGLINKNQKGATLVELLIVIAISGIISSAASMTIFQVFNGSARSSNHMTAIKQVQNAGYWVSHDAQMAQSTNATGATGFPLTLTWTDWSGNEHQAVYSLVNMSGGLKRLERTYSIGGTSQGTISVAQHIDPVTSCNVTDDVLIFTVTATVGGGSQQGSETKVYRIIPRPSS